LPGPPTLERPHCASENVENKKKKSDNITKHTHEQEGSTLEEQEKAENHEGEKKRGANR
jgi:hypothetical protein